MTLVALMLFTVPAFSGDLEPPGPPTEGTMHTLEEIYNMVAHVAPAPVPKTGRTVSYGNRDDGELQMGVAWPDPRFTDNGDGTATDNLTGLVWTEEANCFGTRTWDDALSDCNNLADGQCGLTDGSSPGDWRLPNVRELQSLIDYGNYNPALPSGHPFINQQANYYWSSTTDAYGTSHAWGVYFNYGFVGYYGKSLSYYVRAVRDAFEAGPPNCGDGVIQWKQGETCDPPGSICGRGGNPNWICSEACACEYVGGG
jgi:hypothetical protein